MPETCLFGITDEETWSFHSSLMIRETLFLAQKRIGWLGRRPPIVSIWKNVVNKTVAYEKLVYSIRKYPNKFLKIWGLWCDSPLASY